MLLETQFFTLYELADGVYSAIAKPGQGAWSNAGFVDLGEEVLVFDAFSTPFAAKELKYQAEALTGKKVKYLVNSHYHGDHVFGNQVFQDTVIISTSLTRQWCKEQNMMKELEKEQEEMKRYLDNLLTQIENTINPIIKSSLFNQYEEMSKVLEALPLFKTVLPMVTFENNLVIHGSKRKVELFCFGGGHTISDTFMYLPEDKIAFMGDLITEEMHVPIYNPNEFVRILKEVKEMDIESVLPGHGNMGSLELFDQLISYISYMIEKVQEAHRNGLALEDFLTGFSKGNPYQNWKGASGINRNLTTVYNSYVREKE